MGWEWGRRVICLVTGASRGIGREIAVQFASRFGPQSLLILLARDNDALTATKAAVNVVSPDIFVYTAEIDLAKPDTKEYLRIINIAYESFKVVISDFDQAVIVHNAGSIGDFKYVTELDNVNTFYDVRERLTINISSKAGLSPTKTFGLYCTGKAARDMLFKTLALEQPSMLVLSYAPGPIDTDMFNQALTVTDPDSKAIFEGIVRDGNLLASPLTVAKLLQILEKKNFSSGDHVDYFDC